MIHVGRTPLEKWTGQASKMNYLGRTKKMAQQGKRPLGRGAIECPLVLLDNTPNNDTRNTVRLTYESKAMIPIEIG